jgi:hypothetical protein
MRPEVLPHARLEDRRFPFGVQPAAVDNADASMTAVPAVLDKPPHVGERGISRHAVQVAAAADNVLASFELPNLPPIDAVRDEIILRCVGVYGSLRSVARRLDWWRLVRAPARVGFESDHVVHLSSECVGVGVGVGGGRFARVDGGDLAAASFHAAILPALSRRSQRRTIRRVPRTASR